MMKNILVAIEGIDGSGKNTQTLALVKSLRNAGLKSDYLSFPRYSETAFGSLLAKYLNGKYDNLHPEIVASLYAGDRLESKNYLIEVLNENDVLVLDRYTYSSVAYQMNKLSDDNCRRLRNGGTKKEECDWIEYVEEFEFEKLRLPKPKLNILIDMPIHISKDLVLKKKGRDYTSASEDIHEANHDYLSGIRDCYLRIIENRSNWRIVKGSDESGCCRSIDSIASDIFNHVVKITRQGVLF
jgi:dTMP kinase